MIPAYNEVENLPVLLQKVQEVLATILEKKETYEIICIDDGSTDDTIFFLRKICKKDLRVKFLSFSRNFGHQAALKAGLDASLGNCVVTMDADLQHPPKLIPTLYKYWKQGSDIVYTVRLNTEKSSFVKDTISRFFYSLFRVLGGVELETGAADFRLLDRKVVNIIKTLPETVLFLRGMFVWVGFSKKAILYTADKRFKGTSKYSLRKMILLALSGITSFSTRPLYIAIVLGLFFSFLSGVYGLYAVSMFLFVGTLVLPGWASIITSILFIGGLQLCMLGILGMYIGHMYIETKKRPLYIVSSSSENMNNS